MRISVLLSLEQLALVKIATSLWNQWDIRNLITKFHSISDSLHPLHYEAEWKTIENDVLTKASNLRLPKDVFEELKIIVNVTGNQVEKWSERLKSFLHTSYIPESSLIISWSDKGVIDQRKTAELLIRNHNDDIVKRYELACNYCLEDYIIELWINMPSSKLEEYSMLSADAPILVNFWTGQLIGGKTAEMLDLSEEFLSSFAIPQNMLVYSGVNGSLSAVKFFMSNMPFLIIPDRIYTTCINSALNHKRCLYNKDYVNEYVELFVSLFNELNEDEQNDVLKKYATHILICLLSWPYAYIFIDMAKLVYSFLPETVFLFLLSFIVKHIKCTEIEYYQNLLLEFWRESNINQKQYVLQEWTNGDLDLLKDLLSYNYTSTIAVILRDGTTEQRESIFFRLEYLWSSYVKERNWSLLKFLIGECIKSIETLKSLKQKHTFRIYNGNMIERLRWKKFSLILKDLIQNYET